MKINVQLFLISSLASAFSTTAADKEIPLCLTTLRDLCGSASGSSSTCEECTRENEAALSEADCNVGLVQRVCGAMDGPVIAPTCSAKLSDLCPVSDYPFKKGCYECAQVNADDFTTTECTIPTLNELCNARDGSDIPVIVPETVLPTGATESNPLRVFLQAGQSGCGGTADVGMMNNDSSYDDLNGVQEGVWFAGIKRGFSRSNFDPSHFFMAPMLAGEGSKTNNTMGPEVSIGRRLRDANLDAPVMIIKYCWGGSNLAEEWNPDSPLNSWDKEQDDGTAEWLLEEPGIGGADLNDKKHLYANLIYTVRRSLELLEEGGIPYDLSGMFWLQGSADKKRTWREYGEDSIAFFEAVRTELGEPSMPIVDNGSIHSNINTGKAYAASVIVGCNIVVPTLAMSAPDPDDDCLPGPSNPCIDSSFLNYDIWNYYGWDPAMNAPEFADLKPPGSSDKIFHWFKNFPYDQHMEYDGKILQGRLVANAYIQSFTNDELTEDWLEDGAAQFPLVPCDPDVNDGKPGPDNICWMDQREAADQAEATCSERSTLNIKSNVGRGATTISMSLSSGTASMRMSSSRAMAVLSSFSAFILFYAMSY